MSRLTIGVVLNPGVVDIYVEHPDAHADTPSSTFATAVSSR